MIHCVISFYNIPNWIKCVKTVAPKIPMGPRSGSITCISTRKYILKKFFTSIIYDNYTNTEYILMYCYLNVLISTMIRWPIIGSEEGWQIQHWNIYICRLKSWKKNLLRNTILQYVILLFFLMLQQNLDIKYQVSR